MQARKALCALKGLVKLQALIRGHLVRRQATATLRSMQAMVTAQARARIQRMLMLEEAQPMAQHRQNNCRRSPLEARSVQSYVSKQTTEIRIPGSFDSINSVYNYFIVAIGNGGEY